MVWRYLNVARKKNVPGEHTHWDAVRQNRVTEPFWPQVGPVFFLTVLFLINFIARIILSPLLPTIEKELGISHGEAGSFFFLISAGYVIALLGSVLPSVPFESQNHHCGFQCGRWFGPPGNITDEKFMGDAHGTLWLGFRRRPLYPFGNRDHHGVDRAAALGKSHRCARAGTQPGFFCRTLCRGIVLGLVNLARRPKCSWRCLASREYCLFPLWSGR